MHVRNPYYANPPNFSELAANFEAFRKCCPLGRNGKPIVDFQKDEVVRTLAKVLLLKDFQLKVDIPAGCLVPRIPQRVNYLLWVDDILKLNGVDSNIIGIDIGTGASCVYALIGAKKFGWRFYATDSDEKAISLAKQNVQANDLSSKVAVIRILTPSLVQDVVSENSDATFCICNPPFYESDEVSKLYVATDSGYSNISSDETRAPPHSATLAQQNELEVEGGEVSFVSRIITESANLRSKVRFYSSMLGKKASLTPLKRLLISIEGVRYCISTLIQGKTQRWIIAWTFDDEIILEDSADSLSVSAECVPNVDAICFMEKELNNLKVSVSSFPGRSNVLKCNAVQCTWRRKRAKHSDTDISPSKRICLSENSSDPQKEDCLVEKQSEVPDADSALPCASNANIRFQVRFDSSSNSYRFDFIKGNKQLLYQIAQFFKNKFKK